MGDRDRGSLPTRHYNGKAAVRGNAFSPSVAPFTAVENDMTNQIRQTVLKGAAVAMFPGKEETFDLIYMPRFSRLLAERYGAN